jgi:hypothetical protein
MRCDSLKSVYWCGPEAQNRPRACCDLGSPRIFNTVIWYPCFSFDRSYAQCERIYPLRKTDSWHPLLRIIILYVPAWAALTSISLIISSSVGHLTAILAHPVLSHHNKAFGQSLLARLKQPRALK